MKKDSQLALHMTVSILAGECSRPVYAMGKNPETKKLAAKIRLAGLVDDSVDQGALWNSLACIPAKALPADTVVVNCSSSVSPISAEARVRSVCPSAFVLQYKDFFEADPLAFELPELVSEMRSSLEAAKEEWFWLRGLMHDENSKLLLDRLIAYRSSFDYHVMEGCSVRITEQYFEDFLPAAAGRVFVDCGGFDGDTTEQFCKRFPAYHKVFLFEPSSTNLARAVARLKPFQNIEFLPLGVSDNPGELHFDPDMGSASAVSKSGAVRIRVTTMDKCVFVPVTFIKMDLEGWEIPALKGSIKHILDDHPVLAIAVYHNADHFWQVARLVMGLREDYHVYLRHYTEGWSETVMYFVPIGAEK